MTKLIGLVKPLTAYMALAVIMGIVGHLCASFITIFGGFAVLDLVGVNVPFSLTIIFISLAIFSVLRAALRYAEQACNHFIAFKLLALIRDKVFQALRKLCPAKLESKDKGDLISVITSDIELLEVFYAHTISPVLIWFFFTLIMTAFIASYHIWLGGLALIAYLTIGVIIPLIISKISGDDGMKFRSKSGALSGFVLDSLRGLSETIQYGQGQKRLAEMNKKTDELSADEERMKKIAGRNIAVTNTVILIFDFMMLFLSAYLYQTNAIGFDGILICTLALFSSFGPAIALANLGSTLQNTFASGSRVLDILEEEPLVEEIKDEKEVSFNGAKAENVTFAYKDEIILDNLSADIPKNSVVGIVGRSGSGKSTLLKLFMRFWKVENGSVKLSDTDIEHINTANLRNMESFVTQETHLFHDSIKNNIRIAKLNATDEEIKAACQKASVHEFIMTLPQGYDTQVGELGDTLSGGERQRIGLARAFLHDAPFMLLDEPTSNLDSLNEAVILRSLHEERKTVNSYLIPNADGTFTRVEHCGGKMIVENYSAAGKKTGSKTVAMELSLFGGFYSGSDHNYFVFGQANPNDSDEEEVMRIVKYSKDFQRIGAVSVYGANTNIPFEAGSLRMTETAGKLYIHTCHEMYTDSDGLNHQANMTFVINENDMSVEQSYYDVLNLAQAGYVSHSFNQFIQTDGENIYRVDHGDYAPRGIALIKSQVGGSITKVDYAIPVGLGKVTGGHYNSTGASVGGFEISSENCIIAGNAVDFESESANTSDQRNIFISITDKQLTQAKTVWLTNYDKQQGINVQTPQLVKIGEDQFLVMWQEGSKSEGNLTTKIVTIDSEGNKTSNIRSKSMPLSDCQPVVGPDGVVRWYVTDGKAPTIYAVNPFEQSQSYIKGDVNEDGKVEISDLRLILRSVCKKVELTEQQKLAADVTEDGKVEIGDLRKVLRYICHKIPEL